MDERKEQLKVLKKGYRKQKGKILGVWKWLFALSIVFGAALVAVKFAPVWVLLYLPAMVTEIVMMPLFTQICYLALGVLGVLLLVSVVGWMAGGKRLKKTEAFLNYRTMRYALKAEKKLQ